MSSRSIDSTDVRALRALGSQGQPVIHRQPQIRAYLRRRLGVEHAALLAEPVSSEDGLRIDWHSEAAGPVLAWRNASPEDRPRIEARVEALRREIAELGAELLRSSDPRMRDQGQLLAMAVRTPGPESYFLVGDQPVLCGWGFERDRRAPVSELSGAAAPIVEAPPSDPAFAPAAEGFPQSGARPRRRIPVALLAVPLLLLLALGVYGLRLEAPEPPVAAKPPDPRPDLQRELDQLRRRYALRLAQCAPPEPPPTPVNCDEVAPDVPARLVIAMDTSGSMEMPASWSAEQEARFLRRPSFQEITEALRVKSRRSEQRMGRAIESVRKLVKAIPPAVSVGLVEFGVPQGGDGCGVVDRGFFGASERARLDRRLQSLGPVGSTPLAAGIEAAGRLLASGPADQPAILVLITDGTEQCRGDPCATARKLKSKLPGLRVAAIDIAGHPALRCIADVTGGKLYQPSGSQDLASVVRDATTAAIQPECVAAGEDGNKR